MGIRASPCPPVGRSGRCSGDDDPPAFYVSRQYCGYIRSAEHITALDRTYASAQGATRTVDTPVENHTPVLYCDADGNIEDPPGAAHEALGRNTDAAIAEAPEAITANAPRPLDRTRPLNPQAHQLIAPPCLPFSPGH